jgi:hypothetical protein
MPSFTRSSTPATSRMSMASVSCTSAHACAEFEHRQCNSAHRHADAHEYSKITPTGYKRYARAQLHRAHTTFVFTCLGAFDLMCMHMRACANLSRRLHSFPDFRGSFPSFQRSCSICIFNRRLLRELDAHPFQISLYIFRHHRVGRQVSLLSTSMIICRCKGGAEQRKIFVHN